MAPDQEQGHRKLVATNHRRQGHVWPWRRWSHYDGCDSDYGYVISSRGLISAPSACADIRWVDIAPPSKVALLRSYVNIAAVTGRAAGGPVGGLLIDSVGWRW